MHCSDPLCSFSASSLQLALNEGRKKKSVQESRFDYYNMDGDDIEDIDLSEDELSHIVEIYDFPTEFKSEDLLKLFQCYQYVYVGHMFKIFAVIVLMLSQLSQNNNSVSIHVFFSAKHCFLLRLYKKYGCFHTCMSGSGVSLFIHLHRETLCIPDLNHSFTFDLFC